MIAKQKSQRLEEEELGRTGCHMSNDLTLLRILSLSLLGDI